MAGAVIGAIMSVTVERRREHLNDEGFEDVAERPGRIDAALAYLEQGLPLSELPRRDGAPGPRP